MKKLLLFTIGLLFTVTAISQRVGVGTVTPSHYFHVLPPAGSGDPVRIEGLQAFNSETDVLVVDPTSGVIRTLPFQQLLDMDTIFFNDTSYMLITDSILADTIFLDSLINLIGDSINTDDQNIDSLTIIGTILTVYIEDGNSASINIQNSVDSLIFAKSDTLYSIIADSALNDTLWIRQLDSLLGIYGDTIFFNDTSYSLIKDSLLNDSLFLDSLIGLIGDSINTDDQNIDSVRLNGTILTVYIEDGNSANIDLQPIVDSALANVPAGSDDQMLTLGVGTATTSIIDIESSASDITIQEGPGIQLTEAGNTLTITGDQDIDSVTLNGTDLRVYIENGLSANVDLQPIVDSALANVPTGSDDQNIDSVTLTGNILEVYIENGTSATVDLSSLNNTGTDDQNIDSVVLTGNILEVFIENGTSATVDLSTLNNTGTDDQNIDSLRLNGTILTTYIENGTFANIDLQPIIDSAISNSTGTDDQQVDNFSLSGTTLTLEIENDGQPAHTVNLASLQDGTGTDDQNIDSVTLVGTNLTVYIENGSSATVDVSSLSGTGTDDQNIDSIRLNGTILTTYIENGLSANIDLQPIIDSALANSQDNDWDINGNGTGLEGNPGTNVASGNYSLSAGNNNTASGNNSTTLGGLNNNASSAFSSITGGANNNASGNYSAILGGASNTASGTRSLVFGNSSRAIHTGAAADDFSVAIGSSDSAVGNRSVVIGSRNTALGINSVIFGFSNKSSTSGYNSFIGGGTYHTITGNGSVILGGTTSTSNGVNSFIGAGLLNQTNGARSAIIGGNENVTLGNNSAVIGGTRDTAFSAYETVLGGFSDGYTASSTNLVVPTDRLLVVGNGTSTAARSNALILYKDGSLEINEAYTLPNVDGGVNQVLQTNGSGVVSWATVSAGGTDDQNIDSLRLNGTILTTYIESGASANIDLQPIIDSAIANASGADNDWDINGNGTGLEGAPGTNTASGTNAIAAGDGNVASGNYSVAFGSTDTVLGTYSVISGGRANVISGVGSSIGGGDNNSINGNRSVIAGGLNMTINGGNSVIGGGDDHDVLQAYSSVLGGQNNNVTTNAPYSSISGGQNNTADASFSTVSGGRGNTAESYGEWVGGLYATTYAPTSTAAWIGTDRLFVVGNGTSTAARSNALTLYKDGSLEINEAYTLPNTDGGANQVLRTDGSGNVSWANVSGGADSDWDINGNGTGLEGNPGTNTASGTNSIAAGTGNTASGVYSAVFGRNNIASGAYSSIGGGEENHATGGQGSFVGGGRFNEANGDGSFVGGGNGRNIANGINSTIAGGGGNYVNGGYSAVVGGFYDSIVGTHSFIGGGDRNKNFANQASVVGGIFNETRADRSAVLGGMQNVTTGQYSSIIGGRGNTAQTYAEVIGGTYATIGSGNQTAYISTDRLFVLGNGTSTAARSNALVLYKDGSLEINEAYTLPNVDGGANQVLRTDGSGNVSWANVSGGADSDWDINGNGTGLEGNPGTNTASGTNSIAAGDGNTASGNYSVTFGLNNNATALYSVVTGGTNNNATGIRAYIGGGTGNTASGSWSGVVTGQNNTASGAQAVVGGGTALTAPSYSEFVVGMYNTSYVPNNTGGYNANDRLFVVGNGSNSFARSNGLVLYKDGSLEINEAYTLPNTDGGANQVLRTDGSGNVSWANVSGGADSDWDINGNGTGLEGTPGVNNASGTNSIAAGDGNNAAGDYSVALGQNNNSPGVNSVSLGTQNTSSGPISMTWGAQNTASGDRATAWGRSSTASAIYSTAFGNANTASGDRSTAWGSGTIASGESSTANGVGNEAFSFGEFVTGTYATNYIPNSPGSYNANDRVFVVGNGSGTATRSNGLTLYKDGSLEINEAYTLPNADGGANQVLTTDGAGNVSWQNGISALPTLASGTYSPTVTEISASVTSVSGLTHQYMRIGNHVHVVGRVQVDWNADGNGFVYVTLPIASDFTLATEDVNGSITELRSGPYGTFNNTYQLQANTGSDLIWLQLQNADGALTKYYQYSLMYIIK